MSAQVENSRQRIESSIGGPCSFEAGTLMGTRQHRCSSWGNQVNNAMDIIEPLNGHRKRTYCERLELVGSLSVLGAVKDVRSIHIHGLISSPYLISMRISPSFALFIRLFSGVLVSRV